MKKTRRPAVNPAHRTETPSERINYLLERKQIMNPAMGVTREGVRAFTYSWADYCLGLTGKAADLAVDRLLR